MERIEFRWGTKKENLGALLALAGAFAMVAVVQLRWVDLHSPRVFVGVVLGMVLWKQFGFWRWRLRGPKFTAHKRLPRATRAQCEATLASELMCITVAAGFFLMEAWTLRDVAMSSGMDPLVSFLLGILAFFPVLLVWRLNVWPRLQTRTYLRRWLQTMGALVPRDKVGKRVHVVTMLLNPFTEEFVYRGVLVCMATGQGVPPVVAILLGALLCASVHFYQGPHLVASHLVFFAAAVGCVVSPAGLWAAFGLHFAADLLPLVTFRRDFRVVREWRTATADAGRSAEASV